jgi:uncharacterized protein YndB with AHSA1/START domain
MKIVKVLLILALVLAAVVLIGGLFIPSAFSVARSTHVAAPPAKVYALVADPRRWKDWSVWNRRDPQMAMSYSGAASGAGAVWSWQSRSEGDGQMTFTEAEAGRRIAYELFFPDFGTTSAGSLTLAPEAEGTRITWTIAGDLGGNPLMRWFALAMDGLIGRDFEAGLANLKLLAERP